MHRYDDDSPYIRAAIRRMRSSGSAFAPSDIPGLVAEFYSEFVVKDGGNLVSQWTDQSGQGNHATQGTDADKFVWFDNQINGYPALRSDGSSDFMAADTLGSVFTGADKPISVFLVVKKINALSVDGRFFTFGNSTTTTPLWFSLPGIGSSQFVIQKRDDDGALVTVSGGSPTAQAWVIWEVIATGTAISIFENGGIEIDAVAQDVNVCTFDLATIGCYRYQGGTGVFANADWAAMLVYDSALSSQNATLVRDFLNTKYAIY